MSDHFRLGALGPALSPVAEEATFFLTGPMLVAFVVAAKSKLCRLSFQWSWSGLIMTNMSVLALPVRLSWRILVNCEIMLALFHELS